MPTAIQSEMYFNHYQAFAYPECQINVMMAKWNGAFQPIAGYVDTGAVRTILTSGAARDIGLDFSQLPQISDEFDLKSCTMHRLYCRKAPVQIHIVLNNIPFISFALEVAFSSKINGNLFGRDWLDKCSFVFDKHTTYVCRGLPQFR